MRFFEIFYLIADSKIAALSTAVLYNPRETVAKAVKLKQIADAIATDNKDDFIVMIISSLSKR